MKILSITGLFFVLCGLLGLAYCIVTALKIKRKGYVGEEMVAKLQPLIPLNLASVFIAIIGLMCFFVGNIF